MPAPLITAVDMGLGHLRAADALARAFGAVTTRPDVAPVATEDEERLWRRTRLLYELLSRATQVPALGRPLGGLLELITRIPPLHPRRDLSHPEATTRAIERLMARGLGAGLSAELQRRRGPLLTTYFVPALVADAHRHPDVSCLVTDTDLARAWVPRDPAQSGIRYFAPSRRAHERLLAYGVRPERVVLTGFPLPHELVGGADERALRQNLSGRLARLDRGGQFRRSLGATLTDRLGPAAVSAEDDRPPLVVFAVGGAGAQSELAAAFLPSLKRAILGGALRLALVAGLRAPVAARFRGLLRRHGLDGHSAVSVLCESTLDGYFRAFNALVAEADVLWTKPSELTFFAALGLPLVLAPPVGAQERYNRRWAIENGAALDQREARAAGDWLEEWLRDGVLASAAWNGFMRLPTQGLYRICAAYGRDVAAASAADFPGGPSAAPRANLSSV